MPASAFAGSIAFAAGCAAVSSPRLVHSVFVTEYTVSSETPSCVTSTFWTDWLNVDTPADNGDYERRSDMPSTLCLSSGGGLPVQGTPIALQAKTTKVIDGVPFFTQFGYAPTDRLSAFDPAVGLKCKPDDQPGDQVCQDYVVRFSCP